MAGINISKTRFFSGAWEGIVTNCSDGSPPKIEVIHLGSKVDFELAVSPETSSVWNLEIPIPIKLLSDGVQVFLINDVATGITLETFTVIAGEPLDDDIRAEVSLIRAELDMLKRAFRRHCIDTA